MALMIFLDDPLSFTEAAAQGQRFSPRFNYLLMRGLPCSGTAAEKASLVFF